MGLFVDISSTSPAYYAELAKHLARHDPGTELAITSVREWDWPLIDQHLRPTWIGAEWMPWYGPRADTPPLQSWMTSIAGVAGMLTPSYRWDQLALDMDCYRQAAARGLDFYVSQEVGIDALGDHPNLRAAWEAYLVELCRQIYALRPTARVLWSPYAWDAWASVTAFRKKRIAAAFKSLIENVKLYSQTPGLTFIDLQDGRGAQIEPETDIVNWFNLIDNGQVRINAEWFTLDLRPQDRKVMLDRLAYYAQHDIPIGCCWEARYWYFQGGWFVNH